MISVTTTARTAPAAAGPAATATNRSGLAPADAFLSLLASVQEGVDADGAIEQARPRQASDDDVADDADAALPELLAQMLDFTAPSPPGTQLFQGGNQEGEQSGLMDVPMLDGEVAAEVLPEPGPAMPGSEDAGAIGGSGYEALHPLQPALPLARDGAVEWRSAGIESGAPVPSTAAPSLSPVTASTVASDAPAVRAPVASPRWAEELGTKLVVMSTRGQHEGSLTLSPEHLGPLEVRINVQQHTASVWFGAQHADTRAALAEALPRLREMFAEAGLSLGHADVSQQAPRDQAPGSPARHGGIDARDDALTPQPARSVRSVTGLLDVYV